MSSVNFIKYITDLLNFQDTLKAVNNTLTYTDYNPNIQNGTVYFSSVLSSTDITAINNAITAYTNPVAVSTDEVEVIINNTLKTFSSTSYTDIIGVVINPQKANLTKFIIACNLDDTSTQYQDPSFQYDIIVYDSLTFTTIVTNTYSNRNESVYQISVPAYPYLSLRSLKLKCRKRSALVGGNIKITYISYIYT
jgi:hypothetical protein